MNPDDYNLPPLTEDELLWHYVSGALGGYRDEGWDQEELDKASHGELMRASRFLIKTSEDAEQEGRKQALKDFDQSASEEVVKKLREKTKKTARRVTSDVLQELDELKELLTVLLDDARDLPFEESDEIARAEGESEAYAYALERLGNAREKIDRALGELDKENT